MYVYIGMCEYIMYPRELHVWLMCAFCNQLNSLWVNSNSKKSTDKPISFANVFANSSSANLKSLFYIYPFTLFLYEKRYTHTRICTYTHTHDRKWNWIGQRSTVNDWADNTHAQIQLTGGKALRAFVPLSESRGWFWWVEIKSSWSDMPQI